MGHKINAVGFRVGIYRNWSASWFANTGLKAAATEKVSGYKKPSSLYAQFLQEDFSIRRFLLDLLPKFSVEEIFIDRAGDLARVTIHASNPGLIIGKKGAGVDSLAASLRAKFKHRFDLSVKDVKNADLAAKTVANSIAEQIEKRVNFKKAMKKAGFLAMKAGASGIKICASGRLGGAEIARVEWLRLGCVPLHTIKSNIDYALSEAKTVYGMIGIRVWICKGEF